jgi:hypothetical protein
VESNIFLFIIAKWDKEKDVKENFGSQSFWNVTDVKDLNADARINATITLS